MDKIKSLEIKKLLKELEFFESDFDYKNEIIGQVDTEFINSINTFLMSYPELKKIYDRKINDKINEVIGKRDIKKETENEKNIDDDLYQDVKVESSRMKKLYRDIAKLSHPDKNTNSQLNEIYLKATKYYNEENEVGLLTICNELNIQYESNPDDISLIKERINQFKNKINFLESTFTWKWYYCEDESQKKQILLSYVTSKIK